jgi:hypothetical protein
MLGSTPRQSAMLLGSTRREVYGVVLSTGILFATIMPPFSPFPCTLH